MRKLTPVINAKPAQGGDGFGCTDVYMVFVVKLECNILNIGQLTGHANYPVL